jgi:DNA-binding CsgD family transcriptional regulator
LVGRGEELELILDAVRGGGGVVIAGGLGVGKTRLARETAAILDGEFSVEWCAATLSSSSIPFGALAHLLPDAGIADDRLAFVRAATARLRDRAGGKPILLSVDDAQWLDGGAAALVHQLTVSGMAQVLLTLRTDEDVPDSIVAIWKDGLADRLELQPLGALEHDALVAAVLDRQVDRTTLRRFWNLSRGNPLFVHELLCGALETDAFEVSDGVWNWTGDFGPATRLVSVLRSRLDRISDSGRTVLEYLAVGEPLTPDALALLCDEDAIAEVERHGLAELDEREGGRFRLCHPVYGEALRGAMGSIRRRQLMTELAETFADSARSSRTELLRVATWRLESTQPGAELLFADAAEVANAVYDHRLAERLARRAVAEGGGLRAALALGDALNRQGRCDEGVAVLEPLAELAATEQEHVAVAIARYFGLTTAYGFRLEFAEVLLAAERHVHDPGLLSFLEAQRATLLCFAGRLEEGVALATRVAADDEIAALRAMTALGVAGLCGGRPQDACDLAERMIEPALRHRDAVPQAPAWVVSIQLPSLVAAGRLDEADAATSFVENMTAAGGASADGPSFLALAKGQSALHRGQARTAAEHLRESVAGMRAIARWRMPFPLAHLTEACALIGDAEGAIEASEEATELVAESAMFDGLARRAAGWAAFARGQRSHAAEVFVDAAHWSIAHGQNTAALFALHDAARFGAQIGSDLDRLLPGVATKWAPCFAAHVRALAADDGAALDAVVVAFEALGGMLLAAEAAAEASASYRRAGLDARAARAEARAQVLAAACEGALTPVLAELMRPLPLTRREREVVELAADGLAAQEIATRLFVSVRTVEGHLNKAYGKLGVKSRADLARVLGASEL